MGQHIKLEKSLGDHNLEILAGFSRTRNSYSQTYLEALNVNYDGTNASMNIFNGTNIIMVDYDREGFDVVPYQDRIESMFARVNYDYKGKYLVNGSVRRDGTSNIHREIDTEYSCGKCRMGDFQRELHERSECIQSFEVESKLGKAG
ncbi:hypothetical protein EJ377_00665 [Chryseobacterium arthrosphaerae]|uniref:TonB-dependent receptor n=1 Tax=Chryseobacterium arthrosphaerae TaxID=651561 RepID=A0A3S0PRN0_9FLAO|nr:hypothetical protein EJ377_00665 [Chryseobacterium arthrosphaerae]